MHDYIRNHREAVDAQDKEIMKIVRAVEAAQKLGINVDQTSLAKSLRRIVETGYAAPEKE